MHTGLVMIGPNKMSKSLGNIIPLRDALKKWERGVLRLWYLHVHYRKPLNFSEESLESAEKLYNRFRAAYDLLCKLSIEAHELHYLRDDDLVLARKLLDLNNEFHTALSEDFNTPKALAVVNEIMSTIFKDIQYNPKFMLVSLALRLLKTFNYVFGLFEETAPSESDYLLNEVMRILINARRELRRQGVYALADSIREELARVGIQLLDRGLETTWVKFRKR